MPSIEAKASDRGRVPEEKARDKTAVLSGWLQRAGKLLETATRARRPVLYSRPKQRVLSLGPA